MFTFNCALEDRIVENCVEFCCKHNMDWGSLDYMYWTVLVMTFIRRGGF